MERIAAIILENDDGEFLFYLKYFKREEIPNIKFANVLKDIMPEYLNKV